MELDEDLGSFNLPIEMSYWNRVDPAGLHKNEKERELTERGLNIHEGDAGIVNQ